MQQSSSFQVYNASAGSGKTFTLVKEYLKVLVQSSDVFRFQKILAITFTNKAAAEMKARVLENLQMFCEGKENHYLLGILEETILDKKTIQDRSVKILDAILQNYAAFSIITIDSFTHKIIKNFAFDLGLSLNFEVEMDAVSLLNEAVDVLISKIGVDTDITKLLVGFSLEKTDDDTSWDISMELKEFSKILLHENDTEHFRKLADKKLSDFAVLKAKLRTQQKELKKQFIEIGNTAIELIEKNDLQYNDFYRSMLPNHFLALSKTPEKAKFFEASTLKERIEENVFYAKSKSEEVKITIESILPELLLLYKESEVLYRQFLMCKFALKSVVPLAVLNHVNSELNNLKEEGNIRLNAEFNQLISDHIKEQPAPFIYERIGQKFTDYFIDEMQDTSVLQWQNLIPLIENALAQENSNLLLVGDAKQAIYRWRGGKASQFIGLGNEEEVNPFYSKKEVKNLETNYRSYSEIIQFNNQFFQHLSRFLQNKTYQKLFFDGNHQKETAKKGGFVSLSFLEKIKDKEENALKYPKKVLEIINHLDVGFSLGDVCVLVRKKKDGVAVANYLSENKIPIVSSETLLLENSIKVQFIVNVLKVIQHPEDKEVLLETLYFLYHHLSVKEDKHTFISGLIHQSKAKLFMSLLNYGTSFKLQSFYQLPFYEKVEAIVRDFKLLITSDAYVQFFLDVILEQQKKGASVQEFLDFWNDKKDSLSIVTSETSNAVQIMTIHKSKGLEFPVVIFPYDLDIYRQVNPKVWFSGLSEDVFNGFDELQIPFHKELSYINEKGLQIYKEQKEELELDNFNLLYVALTRSVEQLYIITEKNISKKGEENTRFYSGIFIDYLKEQGFWSSEVSDYIFGNAKRVTPFEKEIQKNIQTEIQKAFISTTWKEHNIYMLANFSKVWNTQQEEAIEFGNLVHEVMAKIIYKEDVNKVLSQYYQQGLFNKDKKQMIEKMIHQIVNHSELAQYYSKEVFVFNEREIVALNGEIVIPDRLVFTKNNEVVIIDYKTGKPLKKHQEQILKYQEVLESMNYNVVKKIVLYLNQFLFLEEI